MSLQKFPPPSLSVCKSNPLTHTIHITRIHTTDRRPTAGGQKERKSKPGPAAQTKNCKTFHSTHTHTWICKHFRTHTKHAIDPAID
mmetsp:Transcript_20166/g.48951  ORF Transcript_20166/g.48951 Transcript_20166/m.48951 type:complete len:86 (-) Transcript_20166:1878-2135(-)